MVQTNGLKVVKLNHVELVWQENRYYQKNRMEQPWINKLTSLYSGRRISVDLWSSRPHTEATEGTWTRPLYDIDWGFSARIIKTIYSCIFHTLKSMVQRLNISLKQFNVLPLILLKSDYCHRGFICCQLYHLENKKQFNFLFNGSHQMAWGHEIIVHFLTIGHTHENIDGIYRKTSERTRNRNELALDYQHSELYSLYTDQTSLLRREGMTSWTGFWKQKACSTNIQVFAEFHYFPFLSGRPWRVKMKNILQQVGCQIVHSVKWS